MKTVLAIDFNEAACDTYKANFPKVRVMCASLGAVVGKLPKADVILGGPPCQPFSLAGKGEGEDDHRDAVPDFIAAVQHILPRMFLMENVPGLLTCHEAYASKVLVDMMRPPGNYHVQIRTLDAVDYGVPQFRARCFWWGIRNDLYEAGVRWKWPARTHIDPKQAGTMFGEDLPPWETIGRALRIWYPGCGFEGPGPVCEIETGSKNRYRHTGGPSRGPVVRGVDEPCFCVGTKGGGNVDRHGHQGGGCVPILSVDGCVEAAPSATITNGGTETGGAEPVAHAKRQKYVCRLTPIECLRLQSGPDDFKWPEKITKTAMHRIVGNGMASGMMHHLAQAFAATDPKSKTMIDLFCGGGLGACGWHGRYWTYGE